MQRRVAADLATIYLIAAVIAVQFDDWLEIAVGAAFVVLFAWA